MELPVSCIRGICLSDVGFLKSCQRTGPKFARSLWKSPRGLVGKWERKPTGKREDVKRGKESKLQTGDGMKLIVSRRWSKNKISCCVRVGVCFSWDESEPRDSKQKISLKKRKNILYLLSFLGCFFLRSALSPSLLTLTTCYFNCV